MNYSMDVKKILHSPNLQMYLPPNTSQYVPPFAMLRGPMRPFAFSCVESQFSPSKSSKESLAIGSIKP